MNSSAAVPYPQERQKRAFPGTPVSAAVPCGCLAHTREGEKGPKSGNSGYPLGNRSWEVLW